MKYDVDKTALYPGFDVSTLLSQGPSAKAPDLGLLHLAQPVKGIPPRKILAGADAQTAAANLVSGATCWALGYGRHDVDGSTTVKEKRVVF